MSSMRFCRIKVYNKGIGKPAVVAHTQKHLGKEPFEEVKTLLSDWQWKYDAGKISAHIPFLF